MSKIFNKVLKEYELIEIEWNFIYAFIKKFNLDIKYSIFLINYMKKELYIEKLAMELEKYIEKEINNIEGLENCLELLIPQKDKKVNGAFFTPEFIASYMVNLIEPKNGDKNIDISCGTGAFILALIKYYKKNYKKELNEILKENIYGVDILDYNIERCKLVISLLACQLKENIEESSFNLKVKNSLSISIENEFQVKFDNIVGNPPYVKYQDLPLELRDIKPDFVSIKKGNFNLYFPFFEVAYNLLKENGKIVYITPNNYFTTLAAESLREFFQEKRCIQKIIDFSCNLIFSVQTYTAITLITKKQQEFIEYSVMDTEITPEKFLNNVVFHKNYYDILNNKKWRLLKSEEIQNIENIENIGINKLGDIVDIKIGIATLADKIYSFIPIKEDEKYYYLSNGKIEKEITLPSIKITNIKTKEDLKINKRRIIFPYKKLKIKNILLEEEELKEKYPETYEYLLKNKEELLERDKGKIGEAHWYAYGRTQGLNNFGIKLLVPTHSSVPRFLYDNSLSSVFTNGYGIFSNIKKYNKYKNLLSLEENLLALEKILNSEVMNYFIKRTSTSLSGGHFCYQKNFIELFSIPNFSQEEINFLKESSLNEVNKYLFKRYKLKL